MKPSLTQPSNNYSSGGTGEGKYPLSPQTQNARAVAFFTRWLPKLKAAFAPAIH